MRTVTLYPEVISRYTSLIEAGLYTLRSEGLIELRYGADLTPFRGSEWRAKPCMRMRVNEADGCEVLVCFDLSDGNVVHDEYLAEADVYFKRGYDPEYLATLTPAARVKVQPMALQYACLSPTETYLDVAAKHLANQRLHGRLYSKPLNAMARIAKRTLAHRHPRSGNPLPWQPIAINHYVSRPDTPVADKIFFRTRVYSPDDARGAAQDGSLHRINDLRADTVRTLRAAFGDRFVGGLRPSPYAVAHYPDCLVRDDPGYVGHIDATKAYLINVTTAGLHGSTGWKLPEFLAAASCVVAETPRYSSAVPLAPGLNYLEFAAPEGCAAACERLLSDPGLASAMRMANSAYFNEHLRPDKVVARCLDIALDREHARSRERTRAAA